MDNHSPLRISCLLPVYNGEQFIEEAVNSILSQSLRNFELIIVDDGSTDETPKKLEVLARSDKRIRVVRQANGGIVSALNAGLSIARADYIARMDADDVAMVDRFEFQADYLDQHAGCVLVGGIARSIAMQDAVQRYATGGRHARTDLSIFPPRIAVSMHPLIMMRTAALRAIGGYRSGYPHAEDYDLFIRLSAHGTIDNPPKEVLFYRRHADAISIKNVDMQERSAVRAELDAIHNLGHGEIAEYIVEPYTRLRIFRRLQTIDINRARVLLGKIVQDFLSPTPEKLLSRNYWRLRSISAFTIAKFTIRWVNSSINRKRRDKLRPV